MQLHSLQPCLSRQAPAGRSLPSFFACLTAHALPRRRRRSPDRYRSRSRDRDYRRRSRSRDRGGYGGDRGGYGGEILFKLLMVLYVTLLPSS